MKTFELRVELFHFWDIIKNVKEFLFKILGKFYYWSLLVQNNKPVLDFRVLGKQPFGKIKLKSIKINEYNQISDNFYFCLYEINLEVSVDFSIPLWLWIMFRYVGILRNFILRNCCFQHAWRRQCTTKTVEGISFYIIGRLIAIKHGGYALLIGGKLKQRVVTQKIMPISFVLMNDSSKKASYISEFMDHMDVLLDVTCLVSFTYLID